MNLFREGIKVKLASFFSGCGGLDLGLSGGFSYLGKSYAPTGFEVCFANDIDKKACKTYEKNLKHQISNESIASIDFRNISADVVAGGFPCQPFSYAGNRKGEGDERGRLYISMIEAIEVIKPKAFIIENVKGLLDINEGETIKNIVFTLTSLGYNTNYKLYNAADFGVPQRRERVFIVGLKASVFNYFRHLQPGVDKKVTVLEALQDLENMAEGGFPNHFWSKAKKNKGQGNKTVEKNSLAPTMRAEHHGNIEFHYNTVRRLSAREAARIQSFPDDFIFYDSTTDAYRQIGNAVPPVLAWHLGTALFKTIKDELKAAP